jgi:hypothetical protein
MRYVNIAIEEAEFLSKLKILAKWAVNFGFIPDESGFEGAITLMYSYGNEQDRSVAAFFDEILKKVKTGKAIIEPPLLELFKAAYQEVKG